MKKWNRGKNRTRHCFFCRSSFFFLSSIDVDISIEHRFYRILLFESGAPRRLADWEFRTNSKIKSTNETDNFIIAWCCSLSKLTIIKSIMFTSRRGFNSETRINGCEAIYLPWWMSRVQYSAVNAFDAHLNCIATTPPIPNEMGGRRTMRQLELVEMYTTST